ncbi:hypothetical protein AX16_003950 [Volvariella volvacea WC 439]|nr:hypothetical protein AX16_003950 [Volvariella volvacea WC 439]
MPLQSLKRCTIGGDVPILESVFYKLSEVPCLEVLEFNGPDDGVIDFVADLVDNIPQCNAHKQVRECSRNFGFEKWTSQDSTDDNESDSGDSDWDSDGEEDDEASEGESGGSGEEGGGSDEDDQNRSGDSHQGLRSSNSNGKDGEKGNLQNPKNKDNDYQALCDDIDYCIECGKLGRLFFPALRKLVFRDFNLEKWWMVDDRQRRLHPITELEKPHIWTGTLSPHIMPQRILIRPLGAFLVPDPSRPPPPAPSHWVRSARSISGYNREARPSNETVIQLHCFRV